jgi:hypothetical protein
MKPWLAAMVVLAVLGLLARSADPRRALPSVGAGLGASLREGGSAR